tara:strand:+ start:67 stop:642 length:576 start_codon:yes stop_codon:yes gene_type:complete
MSHHRLQKMLTRCLVFVPLPPGMPKLIKCAISISFGTITVTIEPELRIGYAFNGKDLAVEAWFSLSTNEIATTLTSAQAAMKVEVDKLPDIGELIDDSLKGSISLLPFQLKFPPVGKTKLGRVTIPSLKTNGLCLSKMKDMVPEALKKIFVSCAVLIRGLLAMCSVARRLSCLNSPTPSPPFCSSSSTALL